MHNSAFFQPYIRGKDILIVTNDIVAPLYLEALCNTLQHFSLETIILPDGEVYKNAQSLQSIYDKLVQHRFHRDASIVALGGGVVGDLAGYAAATYQRGIGLLQVPTTLLSQVDSSVGGKTAINHAQGKNLIGAFYQPQSVIIDWSSLHSLPERERAAGMGEVFKYAFLDGDTTWTLVDDYIRNHGLSISLDTEKLLLRCCAIKANYVVTDEKESGIRALLNFGHTFAHAFEKVGKYKELLHGEAVALGMICALHLSKKCGHDVDRPLQTLQEWMCCCQLPQTLPSDYSVDAVMQAMKLDKKVHNNALRFILCRQPGQCYIDTINERSYIKYAIEAVL